MYYYEVKDEEKCDDKIAYFGVILVVERIADESDRAIKGAGFGVENVDGSNFQDDPEWIS